MKVAGAFDKCIRRRIKRSFICDGSRGLILVQIYDFFEKCPDFCNFLGAKSEMMDEMGRDGFKFGIFDMGRCALISGPQKCWFWPNFHISLRGKSIFLFPLPSSSPRTHHFSRNG